ncbi:helix-turn-helix transcriptional regulator [Proteus vulgaris]|uniref:LexA family transcriptional regulator n=1 Tax=Proteus vulgaris TaxID=585 RepID=UPI0021B0F946|nr:helix-turn-helix transcriptional regulator [Proteus vulgaris]MCT6519330.1 helix-turn-helix transcriptional regulator [Proteus vulgaris]
MVNYDNKTEFTKRLQEACLDSGIVGRGVGKRIIDALAEQGIKVSAPAVWKWLNGESIPDPTNILALSQWLDVRAEWLEYGRGAKKNDGISVSEMTRVDEWDNNTPIERDEVEIPFYTTIELAAGFGSCTTDNQKVELLRFSRSTFNRYGVQPSDAVAFKVHGDSMSPVIPDGSIVTISTGHTKIVDGGIYAIQQGDLLRVKILHRLPNNTIIIRSYNTIDYPDERSTLEEVKILGRVFNWSVMGW